MSATLAHAWPGTTIGRGARVCDVMTALGVDHPALRARFGQRHVRHFDPEHPRWAQFGSLASLPRVGWIVEGIRAQSGREWHATTEAESVLEHTLKVRDIAVHIARRRGLDVRKVERMALLHDLAEAITGDLLPPDSANAKRYPQYAAPPNKRNLEHVALRRLDAECGGLLTRSGLMAVLEEYEARQSPEAKLVKQVDGFDCAIQALAYAKADKRRAFRMNQFVSVVRGRMKDTLLRRVLNQVEAGAKAADDVYALMLRLLISGA